MRKIAVAVVVAGVGVSGCGASNGNHGQATAASATKPTAAQARRTIASLDPKAIVSEVEQLRGLKFKHVPKFKTISTEQAGDATSAKGASAKQKQQLAIQVDLLKLVGVLPKDFKVGQALRNTGEESLLGYYDPKSNQLRLVASPAAAKRAGVEPVAAHELTHALQDQHFDLKLGKQRSDEAATAYRALVEGDAKLTEVRYAKARKLNEDAAQASGADSGGESVPFALQFDTAAPYELGAEFAAELVQKAHSNKLLNKALASDPPTSTVEILDPGRYVAHDPSTKLDLVVSPPDGYQRLLSKQLGAFDAIELAVNDKPSLRPVAQLAALLDAGTYELYRQGGDCSAPCTAHDIAVLGLRFKTAAAAQSYAKLYLASLAKKGATGRGTLRFNGGLVTATAHELEVRVTYAPDQDTLRSLAH